MTLLYRLCRMEELTQQECNAWNSIQSANASLHNPFFSLPFASTISSVRNDVEVVVIQRDQTPVGFFPFQRSSQNVQAIAGRLSEYHGLIAAQDLKWSPKDLMRTGRFRSWHFDHLPPEQSQLMRYAWGAKLCPFVDLKNGYEAYRQLVKSRGSAITNIERKSRKLEREVGPLRFEWHDPRSQVLDTLRDWKTEQHRRTGVLEIFQHEWVNKMLEQLMRLPSNLASEPLGFQAPVSTLYAGDHLVALHFGLCTASTLHIWFPAYNEAYGAYSPGNVLLQKMAQAHAARGGQRIDFGPGEERYKQDFKSDDKLIFEGMISLNPIQASARGMWFKTKKGIRRSRFRSTLEFPLAATRKLRQWLAFR